VIPVLVIALVILCLAWNFIPVMSHYGPGPFVETGRGVLEFANECLAEPLVGSFSDATFGQWLKGCLVIGMIGAALWGSLYWVLRRSKAKETSWAMAFWAGISGLIWGLASWAQINGKLETLALIVFLVPFGLACYQCVKGLRLLGGKTYSRKVALVVAYFAFFLLSMLLAAVVGIAIAMIAITIYVILGIVMGGGRRRVRKPSRACPSPRHESQSRTLEDGTHIEQDYAGSTTWHNRDYSPESYEQVGEDVFKQKS